MSGAIVLLTIDGIAGRMLANSLVVHGCQLAGVLLEERRRPPSAGGPIKAAVHRATPQPLWDRVSRWKRHLAAPKWHRRLRRTERRLSRRAEDLLASQLGERAKDPWPAGIPVRKVRDVNSEEVHRFLAGIAPDLLAVRDTSILEPQIFDLPKLGTLNAHPAMLPAYRGSAVEFWQVYNDDFKQAGVTIHFIDKSVDSGDIVFQQRFDRSAGDARIDPFMLRAHNTLAILEHYPRVIQEVLEGAATRRPQGEGIGPIYRHVDLTPEKRHELFSKFDTTA